MQGNLKKKLFHFLTNGNEDVSYYSEVYLEKYSNTFYNQPLTFLMNLMKIRYYNTIGKSKTDWKLKGTKNKNFQGIYYRHNSYNVAKTLMKYGHVYVNVIGMLLFPICSKETLYKMLEREYGIKGFASVRKELEDETKSIDWIYEEISEKMGQGVTPEKEMNFVKKVWLINPYILEILDAVAANHIPITVIENSSYGSGFFKELLEYHGVSYLKEIVTSAVDGKPAVKGAVDRMKQAEKQMYDKEYKSVFFSQDFEGFIRPLRKKQMSAIYSPSPLRFCEKLGLPNSSMAFGDIHKRMAALGMYAGGTHSEHFRILYCYLAPIVYEIISYIERESVGKKILFLGNSENVIFQVYERVKGNATCVESSYLAFQNPTKDEDWYRVLSVMPSLCNYTAEALTYDTEKPLEEYIVKKQWDRFLKEWSELPKSKQDRKVCTEYLEAWFGEDKDVLVVDVTEGTKCIEECIRFLSPKKRNVDYITWKDCIKNDSNHEELKECYDILDCIFQMDGPILANISTEKFSFIQPKKIANEKKELLYAVMESYCRQCNEIRQVGDRVFSFTPEYMFDLFSVGKEGIKQYREELFQ